jgi:hypothetical protein
VSDVSYRPDWAEARQRLTTWWHGGDLGRPVLQITAPRATPVDDIPPQAAPEGWVTHYSWRSVDYRVHLARHAAADVECFGEAVPSAAPGDLGPNCLALYLGCTGVERPGTVWFEPCLTSPEAARFAYDPDNFYWGFTQRAHRATLQVSRGKFLHQFPDLIEGLDTLAAMRGTELLLQDLLDRPQWVHDCLRRITDLYFHYYDMLYDLIRDEVGGSVFWCWAPGRLVKLQCDFSAMISPVMFREFMFPILCEMAERTSYSLYHLDGPQAIGHLDTLLAVPGLDMIQWTPGAGQPGVHDPQWWPMYHHIIAGGKRIMAAGVPNAAALAAMRQEFGAGLGRMLITMAVTSADEAQRCLDLAGGQAT